jgi:tripartite-type tricarboxylate transporter receptor subunit TctC
MRRSFLATAAAAALSLLSIVPAPGGGGNGDAIARVLAEELGKRLKTTYVIDNKSGANGYIGAAAAAKESADGQHFLFSWAGTLAVNPSLYKTMPFDTQKDFVPVALVVDVPNILVVNNDLPAKDLAEFTRYAKAKPGKLSYGSTGIGRSMHLAAEPFSREVGAQMVHVPYDAPGIATTNRWPLTCS